MRIIHVIGSLDPAGGGPPAVAARLAAAQAQLGHEVSLVSVAESALAARIDHSLKDIPSIDQVRRIGVTPPTGPGTILPVGSIDQRLAVELESADFMHVHGIWEPLLRSAARAAYARKVAYAITPHGMLDPWCLNQKRLKKRIAMMLGYRRMLDRAAFIHALNSEEARLLEPLRLKAAVRIVPNGIFLEEVEPLPAPGRFREMHPELGDRPFVLFLSRLHYKKGLDYLADAFEHVAAKHPQIQLVVAGPDGGAKDEFQQRVGAAGLSGRVHLVGPIYGRAKYEAMIDATCFCLPSRQEGFSIAITEALACGLPVVITENCHFPEVAEVGAGRVVPLDAERIAAALLDVAGDEAVRREIGDAGRRLVKERFTWPRIAERLVEVYRGDSHDSGHRITTPGTTFGDTHNAATPSQ